MKKVLKERQTLGTGCSNVEPKIFAPPQTPFPGGMGWPKFNQLEMVTTFTYKPSLVRIDISYDDFELLWQQTHPPTYKHTHPPTDRTDYNTLHCS